MKQNLLVVFLVALFAMPAARAEGTYAGVIFGQVKSEEIETDNIGFVIGSSPDKGAGLEFFYAPTLSKDELSVGSIDADITLDTYGMLVYYKTGDDDFAGYVKVKAGVAVVDLEFDFDNLGSIDDDTSGLAYGIAIGTRIGSGALEVSYMVLPEFDEFQGIEIDANVDMFGISYYWDF